MTDCPNAEMRDRLPDLLHERLDEATRARVAAHVESCVDCRAELTLLREAVMALTSDVRSVDVAALARAVVEQTRTPSVASLRSGPRSSWRSSFMDWRVAASIAVLVVGSGVLLSRGRHSEPQQPTSGHVALLPRPNVAGSTTVASRPFHHETATTASSPSAELSAGGEVGDLSESDLRALLNDLNGMDAVPSTEPEPVVVRVALPGGGGSD